MIKLYLDIFLQIFSTQFEKRSSTCMYLPTRILIYWFFFLSPRPPPPPCQDIHTFSFLISFFSFVLIPCRIQNHDYTKPSSVLQHHGMWFVQQKRADRMVYTNWNTCKFSFFRPYHRRYLPHQQKIAARPLISTVEVQL